MLRWWCGCWRADPTVAVAPPDPSPRQCQWNLLHPRCTHGSSPVVAVIRTAPTVNIGGHLSGIPFAGAWQFPRTTIREIKILKSLRHNNLVRLREIVTSTPSITQPKHEDKAGSIFLVFEYLPYDLAALVESPMKYVTNEGGTAFVARRFLPRRPFLPACHTVGTAGWCRRMRCSARAISFSLS